MADKKANLILSLQDFASKGIGAVAANLAVLRQGVLAIYESFTKLIDIFSAVLNAYGEQETAVNKLNQALQNQGIQSQAVTDDLIAFAGELQKTTTYADEVVLSAMALGTTFGLTGERLKATTNAAADMSAALGTDLKTTMLLLGKAAFGETGTLSRYGIIIDENIPKAQRFEAALAQVNSRFGGTAAAQAKTYAGKVLQMKNSFDEVLETLGGFAAGPAVKALNFLKEAAEATALLIDPTQGVTGVYSEQILVVREKVKAAEENLKMMRQSWIATDDDIKQSEKRLGIQRSLLANLEKNNEAEKIKARILAESKAKAPAGAIDPEEEKKKEKEKQDLIDKATLQIDTTNLTEDQLANIRTNAMAKELMDKGQQTLAIQLLGTQQTVNTKKQNEERKKNAIDTMNYIAGFSSSHNKTLAAIGKAAAIGMATVDTFAAANKALASAPPPYNFILSKLVLAAGLANVASMAGVKLAEGGMIMPRNGGTSAIMAEAGRAEVAIPLDDPRTKEKLRDTFGGGGNTVIIQAGTIVADDYSVEQFAQKLDKKLFELQRNRRSYQ